MKRDDTGQEPGGVHFVTHGNVVGGVQAARDVHIGERPAVAATGESPGKEAHVPVPVLFLAAKPADSEPLRLDREVREVDLALRASQLSESFELRQCWAVQASDILDSLLRYRPRIVHFAGHGEQGSLLLEDSLGVPSPVPAAALARLFRTFRDDVRCVVLNFCGSLEQAKAIGGVVDCAIGMSREVAEDTAAAFAVGFYRSLAAGRSVRAAFELGCVEMDMRALGDGEIPELICERGDPNTVIFG